MTEEFHQQIGKMLSSMEHNTKLTEKIAGDVDSLNKNMSELTGVVKGHGDYLKNLDDRIVTQRVNHERLHERVTVIETKSESTAGIFKWIAGILSAIIGSIITFLFTHK